MGLFYGTKIKFQEVNPKTGKQWELADVPTLWRKKTETWLEDN